MESPHAEFKIFGLWHKLLKVGDTTKPGHLQCLLRVGHVSIDDPAWPIFVTLSHLLQRPSSNMRLEAPTVLVLGLGGYFPEA